MPAPVFTIAFPPGETHRVQNFAEDLYRQIELPGIGTVADINESTTVVVVALSKRRHSAAVRSLIQKELERHFFADTATVSVAR